MEGRLTHHGYLLSPKKNLKAELSNLKDLNCFKGVKILSLKLRSLLPKINLLRSDLVDVDFDVLAICETWLKASIDTSLISINNYHVFRGDRSTLNLNGDIKFGGGLALYCNPVYTCIKLDRFSRCTADLETLCISMDQKDHMKIIILNIYRPPAGCIPVALDFLSDAIEQIMGEMRHIELYIVGDFNLDLLQCNNNTKRLTEICANNNLFNLINTPTRITMTRATILDLCITNCNQVHTAGVIT